MSTNEQSDAEQRVHATEAAHVKAILEQDEAALLSLWSPEKVVNAPSRCG